MKYILPLAISLFLFSACKKSGGNSVQTYTIKKTDVIEIASMLCADSLPNTNKMYIGLSNSNTFFIEFLGINPQYCISADCALVGLGPILNIGSIDTHPTSGWGLVAPVVYHNGYVVRYHSADNKGGGYTYAKFYVSDTVGGYTVQIQNPF